jgi:hypothetical protein
MANKKTKENLTLILLVLGGIFMVATYNKVTAKQRELAEAEE